MRTTILVVEDDPFLSDLVAITVAEDGFEVVTARDGAEALRLLEAHAPIGVVLEPDVPEGCEFYRELRASARDEIRAAPVLVVSSGGAKRLQRELGAEAGIEKPFDPREIVFTLLAILPRQNAVSHN